jgi:opacity protein-like surface antigen
MKQLGIGLSCATVLAGAGVALSPPAVAQTMQAPPAFSWEGFYAGVAGGFGQSHFQGHAAPGPAAASPQTSLTTTSPSETLTTSSPSETLTLTSTTFTTTQASTQTTGQVTALPANAVADLGDFSLHDESWFIGAQAGYDKLVGPVIVGGVIDISGGDFSSRRDFASGSVKVNLDWFATARIKVGMPFDRVLIYGTGGVAFGGIKGQLYTPSAYASDSFTKTGWVAGLGASYAVTDNIVVDLSYLHLGFGSHSFGGTPGSAKVKVSSELVRFGVGYKF